MIFKKIFLVLISFFLLTTAFSQPCFKTIFVKGFTNNTLEVLDWGGKGRPILFISGLGNTAHVFEDFAPKFINDYHVYGMTRRGFGKSERTNIGFDTDTLVKDITKVLNYIGLKKIILIGHSIAGDEISTFARTFPNKILATVYLDAALNHSYDDSILGKSPQKPSPPNDFKPTLNNLEEDYFKSHGFYFPIGEINNSWGKFDNNRLLVNDTTTYYGFTKIIQALKPITYKNIKCPSLAIYVKAPTAPDRFKAYDLFDSTNKRIAEEALPRWTNYYTTEIERYKKECSNCKVEEILGAHHVIFLSHPKETEILIRNFLKNL